MILPDNISFEELALKWCGQHFEWPRNENDDREFFFIYPYFIAYRMNRAGEIEIHFCQSLEKYCPFEKQDVCSHDIMAIYYPSERLFEIADEDGEEVNKIYEWIEKESEKRNQQ